MCTKVHVSTFLFVRTCRHVKYTNTFSGSEEDTTFLITPLFEEYTRPWNKMVSPMTQNRDHVTTFSSSIKTYEFD